ncbi:hypothetical protein DA075_03275 [Methylobacterium currus]|uniref:Uncharacterized protein n=1 Tax=Methylobacterium currus TaxID=2051553 RepID=A0A2R4WEZ1_9HYPH|nr:hypothetical protein [Methylobacterium currus]AWB20078.1 hypothetical protein DA075_03275 [Methylobacterium currus]
MIGDVTHVAAGPAATVLPLISGEVGPGQALGGMILPALLGYGVGGPGLFALLAHAQVPQEL